MLKPAWRPPPGFRGELPGLAGGPLGLSGYTGPHTPSGRTYIHINKFEMFQTIISSMHLMCINYTNKDLICLTSEKMKYMWICTHKD